MSTLSSELNENSDADSIANSSNKLIINENNDEEFPIRTKLKDSSVLEETNNLHDSKEKNTELRSVKRIAEGNLCFRTISHSIVDYRHLNFNI